MIIPPRVPLTDPRTGMIAREWYLFFVQLFEKTGGDSSDIAAFELEPISYDTPIIDTVESVSNSQIESLQNEIESLKSTISSLQSNDQDIQPPTYPPLVPFQGTFTPTVIGTTLAGAGTYTTQTGRFLKIGNLCFCTITMAWTAHTGTGNMQISGLPFSAQATDKWICVPEFANMTMPASSTPFGAVIANTSTMGLYSQAVASGAITALAMDTSASVYASFSYETQ